MKLPVLSQLDLYKWGAVALLLLATHGAVFWKTWSWRDSVAENARTAAELKAANDARRDEQTLAAASLEIEREYTRKAAGQAQEAQERAAAVARLLAAVPACPVPAAVVHSLQPDRFRSFPPRPPRAAREPDAAATPAVPVPGNTGPGGAVEAKTEPAGIDVSVLLDVADANYREVCEPNALQLEWLQRWVTDIRARYEELRGRD